MNKTIKQYEIQLIGQGCPTRGNAVVVTDYTPENEFGDPAEVTVRGTDRDVATWLLYIPHHVVSMKVVE